MAQRARQAEPPDLNNMESKARAAHRRAKNYNRLQAKHDSVVRDVGKAHDTLVALKGILAKMRKQIVLAQDPPIDDTQRRKHGNEFGRLLGEPNMKVRIAGPVGAKLIGSSNRDIFTPDTLSYKIRSDSPTSQTVTGIYSGSDYFATDANGDTYHPDLYRSILKKFPETEGHEGLLVSGDDVVDYDPATGAISLTRVTAQRDFNANLVEEHRAMATKVETTATLEATQAAFEARREALLFGAAFETTLTVDGGGSLVALGFSNPFDVNA